MPGKKQSCSQLPPSSAAALMQERPQQHSSQPGDPICPMPPHLPHAFRSGKLCPPHPPTPICSLDVLGLQAKTENKRLSPCQNHRLCFTPSSLKMGLPGRAPASRTENPGPAGRARPLAPLRIQRAPLSRWPPNPEAAKLLLAQPSQALPVIPPP